jgi:signal recognition particle subunit SRP54
MLKNLGSGLKETFKKITRISSIDKNTVESIIKDIQRVLLESDVNVEMVAELSERLKKKILEEKPPAALTLREYFIKTLYDEIVNFVGKEKGKIELKKQRILLIGLFGSGKTTTCAKLAKWFKTRGLNPALVACDTHRAAAQQQLKQLGKQIEVNVYFEGKNPEDIAKNAIKKAKEDVLIFDSAGRSAMDKELASELKKLSGVIKPDEVLLVIPADIGQDAKKQAEEFQKLVGITGVIVTKMDGTAKGGAALASAAVTGSKVKFIGVGEKISDLEEYDPQRFVSRLIGYGDIQGLLEKAKEVGIDEKTAKRLLEGEFTLEDFYEQINSMQKMGSLSKIVEMIPGIGTMKLPLDKLDVQEEKMKKWRYIIDSMTKQERNDPSVINQSRIKRIAKGSGTKQEEVRELLKYYKKIKKIMKMTKGGKALKRGPFARLAKQMGLSLK